MSETSNLFDLYLIFKESEMFADLDEEALLSFLQLCHRSHYPGSSVILKEGADIPFVYAFLDGIPTSLKASGCIPFFWGLEALVAPQSNSFDLIAPPEGTQLLLFSVPRLIAFLNETPDILISLLKQTTST